MKNRTNVQETAVLAKEKAYWTRKIHQGIEIFKWPNNLNWDKGYGLSHSWTTCLSKQSNSRKDMTQKGSEWG